MSYDAYFWEGVKDRTLLLRRCAGCGELQHPPTPMCGHCHGLEWETQKATGRGTVYSWIVSRHPSQPDDNPRIVALVELAEGVRLVSNLIGIDAADVRNDMEVEVTFVEYGDDPGVEKMVLPHFTPVAP
ncbi:MAG: hypothetical protein QOI61_656 [Actinomycetota bacterium]|jgi:uncharacterized OB-fold protein